MLRSLIAAGLAGLSLLALSTTVAQTQAPAIQGAWRIAEVVVTGANASSNTTPQPALYIFTKQHYSITAIGGSAPRKGVGAAKDPAKLTDTEKIARFEMWNPFTANAGTYAVKGSTLTTTPLVAKNEGVIGQSATREFELSGSTLTLIQRSAAGRPASETRTKLTRVE